MGEITHVNNGEERTAAGRAVRKTGNSDKLPLDYAVIGNAAALERIEGMSWGPVQRMGVSWEDYLKRYEKTAGIEEIFAGCDFIDRKATWKPPEDFTEFDCFITLHDCDEKTGTGRWGIRGYVEVVLRNKSIAFHTQSKGGNQGVATFLFPRVLDWVKDLRRGGVLEFDELSMGPAGGAASKTVMRLLSQQIGDETAFQSGEAARDARIAAGTPVPKDPNEWINAYTDEFAHYIDSLKKSGLDGLSVISEVFNLIGEESDSQSLFDGIETSKALHLIPFHTNMTRIGGETEFEKLLILFKMYMNRLQQMGRKPAGSRISLSGDALDRLM